MENVSEKELEVAEPVIEVETDVAEEEQAPVFTESGEEAETETVEESQVVDDQNDQKEYSPLAPQSKEENAKYAQARRKAEAELEQKVQKAYEKGKLEAFQGKVNPFTNTLIQDYADVEMYETMLELAEKGKDPINDLHSELANKIREKDRIKQEEQVQKEKAAKEIEDFQAKYPNIDLSELLNDPVFSDYAEGKNRSILETYESFTKLKNSFRTKAVDTAKQTIANAISSPGSLGSTADQVVDYSNMSREEFLKIVEKVKNGE